MAMNLFKVPATSITVPKVTLQTAAHGSLTFAQNIYFMAVGDNVDHHRQLEILDAIEWLMTRAAAQIDTPRFPRPVAAGITAYATDVLSTSLGPKKIPTLINNATISDPFAGDLNAVYFGLTGSAGANVNQAVQMGSRGLESAFEVMKAFSLIGASIWT